MAAPPSVAAALRDGGARPSWGARRAGGSCFSRLGMAAGFGCAGPERLGARAGMWEHEGAGLPLPAALSAGRAGIVRIARAPPALRSKPQLISPEERRDRRGSP